MNVSYGAYLFWTQYDNSEATLILDSDLNTVRVRLEDQDGNPLDYPDELGWEVVLSIQSVIPEGFQPMEA